MEPTQQGIIVRYLFSHFILLPYFLYTAGVGSWLADLLTPGSPTCLAERMAKALNQLVSQRCAWLLLDAVCHKQHRSVQTGSNRLHGPAEQRVALQSGAFWAQVYLCVHLYMQFKGMLKNLDHVGKQNYFSIQPFCGNIPYIKF